MESGIHTAECTRFMEKMEEKVVDLVVTSPPYDDLRDYEGFTFDCEAVAKASTGRQRRWRSGVGGG